MISQAAISLILEDEGLDQPSAWPGLNSGVTIGRGYDLGYTDSHTFVQDWQPYLAPGQLGRLLVAIGKTGQNAKALSHSFGDIQIHPADADSVFISRTIPDEESKTSQAFPGSDLLPDDARGALVSLVYNRGPEMADSPTNPDHDRRREMRAIRQLISNYSHLPSDQRPAALPAVLSGIAGQLRSMKRLWIGKGEDGLLTRREAEAKLVEGAIPVERAVAV